jgi:hypothetical protein
VIDSLQALDAVAIGSVYLVRITPADHESRAREMHRHVSDDRVLSPDRDLIDRQCDQFSRDRVSSGIVGWLFAEFFTSSTVRGEIWRMRFRA